jgi:hypothetical protein
MLDETLTLNPAGGGMPGGGGGMPGGGTTNELIVNVEGERKERRLAD